MYLCGTADFSDCAGDLFRPELGRPAVKLALISTNRNLYSTRRLWEAARKAGHDVRFLHPRRCTTGVDLKGTLISTDGLRMEGFDAAIPRFGASQTRAGLVLLDLLQARGVVTLNTSAAIERCRDKLRSIQHLAIAGLPVPPTVSLYDAERLDETVDQLGGLPIIIKLIKGSHGVGVIRCDTIETLRSTVETLWSLNEEVLLQRYIGESAGKDLRVFVVAGEVVGAMERRAGPGEFRANLHRGGSAQAVDLSDELREIALRATEALGLGIAGVDLLMSAYGPLILEVNASPGLEGIEAATGKDIARQIIRATTALSSS
ncbi:RimK family alpha-L-glutamate ligase [Lujinxingia sediminis]|uniref:RimK family alpha-L-glutamate ligase n=1 Tax=Lujinxingia sediminis TaxID=2480984 RepID=A0ABY0CW86_9DELT|nr:RimK family alpha-L-glutamate ligase [Lujinxingia sediminis]